jgi:uncharacterized membrane protein
VPGAVDSAARLSVPRWCLRVSPRGRESRGGREVVRAANPVAHVRLLGVAIVGAGVWGLFVALLTSHRTPASPAPPGLPTGLARIGLPEALLQQVRNRTRPGTSALFVPAASPRSTRSGEALVLSDDGGAPACLTTILAPDEESALRRAFGMDDTDTDPPLS